MFFCVPGFVMRSLFRLLFLAVYVFGAEDDHSSDFDTYDGNRDGFLDAQEIRVMYKDLSERELMEFWAAVDQKQRGFFDKAQYISYALGQGEREL